MLHEPLRLGITATSAERCGSQARSAGVPIKTWDTLGPPGGAKYPTSYPDVRFSRITATSAERGGIQPLSGACWAREAARARTMATRARRDTVVRATRRLTAPARKPIMGGPRRKPA